MFFKTIKIKVGTGEKANVKVCRRQPPKDDCLLPVEMCGADLNLLLGKKTTSNRLVRRREQCTLFCGNFAVLVK